MKYKPPIVENQAQFVPIVIKNRDFLIGYISALQLIESVIVDTLRENGIEIDLRSLDLCLDSSRFNDILEDGRRESECTDDEMKKYFNEMVQRKTDLMSEDHPDNNESVFDECFLTVECLCGLGIYSFKTSLDIPDKPLKCENCGRLIIDYTGHDDEEYDFDGQLRRDDL